MELEQWKNFIFGRHLESEAELFNVLSSCDVMLVVYIYQNFLVEPCAVVYNRVCIWASNSQQTRQTENQETKGGW